MDQGTAGPVVREFVDAAIVTGRAGRTLKRTPQWVHLKTSMLPTHP